MKRSHKTYFEEDEEEPYLCFKEGDDLIEYQSKINTFILPSENLSLLKHIQSACTFLDVIYETHEARLKTKSLPLLTLLMTSAEDQDQQEEKELIFNALRLDQVTHIFFRWHSDISHRDDILTGLYAVNYFLSWSCFARAFHLVIYVNKDKLTDYAFAKAHEDPYCKMVGHYENICVTEKSIIAYSINQLWNSMRIIIPSLYTYVYSKPMCHYIYLLFFKYGDLLVAEQDLSDLESIFDNPLFIRYSAIEEVGDAQLEEFDGYKRIGINVYDSYILNNEFLFQGEALFYHQLKRIQLSNDLLRFEKRQTITIRYSEKERRTPFIKLLLEQWCAMCIALSVDKHLRKPVIEQYSMERLEMYLYHGERERYKRQFPNSSCETKDILLEIRSVVMTHISNTQHLLLRDIVVNFKNEYLASLEEQFAGSLDNFEQNAIEQGLAHWRILGFEQEALLLTKIATTIFLDSQAIEQVKLMRESFILEELVSLEKIEDAIFLQSKRVWPIFLKLMRLYYVIDLKEKRVFKSIFFVEAYFVWLALAQRHGLLKTPKKTEAIHTELLAPLKKLNTLLQF